MQASPTVGLRTDILGSGLEALEDPSGFLSVNIFWEHKKGVRLCKTNCRSIEVPLLYPASLSIPFSGSSSNSECEGFEEEIGFAGERKEALGHPAEQKMAADQEHPEISPITNLSRVPSASLTSSTQTTFQFLGLPLELRLKIYTYLLPSRHHTIVTQLPHNGYFYNTSSIPAYSAQSFYPFGTKAPNNLTTYKVLSSNFRSSFPHETIYPAILGTSRQVKEEAETVLYGSSEAVWDFGVHSDACRAFWEDRSSNARKLVKSLRVAREVPCFDDGEVKGGVDERWVEFCHFLKSEMSGLRVLDLTVWGSGGSAASFPSAGIASLGLSVGEMGGDWIEEEVEIERMREEERKWREWEWISELLQMDALRQAKITWWGFENLGVGGTNGEGAFDSWLAGRMVGDKLVRDRMVREGVVVEGVVVLSERGITC